LITIQTRAIRKTNHHRIMKAGSKHARTVCEPAVNGGKSGGGATFLHPRRVEIKKDSPRGGCAASGEQIRIWI